MKIKSLKWDKEDQFDLSFKFVLFFISPFVAFIYSLKRLNTRSSYVVLYFTAIFFGIAFSIDLNEAIDASRHRYYFELDYGINIEQYLERILNYLSFEGNKKDIFRDSVSFLVTRFTNNYHWFFMTIAAIYGYFSLRSLRFLTSCEVYRFNVVCLLLLYLFLMPNIFHINGVRFWTAGWVYIYAVFQMVVLRKNKYILLVLLTPLIHISFWVLLAFTFFFIALVYSNLIKRYSKVFLAFYIVSLFFSFFSVTLLKYVGDYLPSIFSHMIASYTNEEYVSKINDFDQTLTGIYFKFAKLVYINFLILLLFIKRKLIVHSNVYVLFVFSFLLMSFVNFTSFIPSLGERFFLLVFPFIAYLWLYTFQGKRYNYIIFLVPIVFFRDIYINFNLFGEVLELSDLYSSPVYIFYKYLLAYEV